MNSHPYIVYSQQLAKLNHRAELHRTDIAEFLCLAVWDGSDIKFLIFSINKNIGAVSLDLVPVDLSLCRFASTVPFNLIANKSQKKMNTEKVDLTPYLADVYFQSEQLQDPSNPEMEFHRFIKSIEIWWKRQHELEIPITSHSLHLTLALINIAVIMLSDHLEGVDFFQMRNRLSRIKSAMVEHIAKQLPDCETIPEPKQAAIA